MVAVSVSPTGSGTAGLLLMKGIEPPVSDEGALAGVDFSLGSKGPESTQGVGAGPEVVGAINIGGATTSAPEVGAGAGNEGKSGEGSGVSCRTSTAREACKRRKRR